jgi:hypothetical protein
MSLKYTAAIDSISPTPVANITIYNIPIGNRQIVGVICNPVKIITNTIAINEYNRFTTENMTEASGKITLGIYTFFNSELEWVSDSIALLVDSLKNP